MRRGNRYLVGVVLGGRSGGSRDAIMRNLLAENLEKAATQRTVAAITERTTSDANADVAEAAAEQRPTQTVQVQGAIQVASASSDAAPAPAARAMPGAHLHDRSRDRRDAAGPSQGRNRPAAADQGVIQTQPIVAHSRLVRADEAGQGQDGAGQGRHGEARLGRRASVAPRSPTRSRRPGPRCRRRRRRRGQSR